MASNKYPQLSYTTVNTSYGIYFVDASNPLVLLRTDDEGLTIDTVETRTYKITAIWYDRSNERIYAHTRTGSQAIHEMFYVTLSTGVVTEMGSITTTPWFTEGGHDIFPIGSDWYITNMEDEGASTHYVQVYKWSSPSTWNLDAHKWLGPGSGNVPRGAPGAVVGTDFYYLAKNTNINFNIHLLVFDSTGTPSITQLWSSSAYSLPSADKWGLIYNDDDDLYFVLKKDGDGKNYLQKWSISGSSMTEIGEYDITWQLNRNTIPTELERAFDADNRKIYQLHENRNRLNYISNLKNHSTGTIEGITEEYLFIYNNSSVSELWKLDDVIDVAFKVLLYHSRNDYPYLKMKFNSDNLTIDPQMLIQIIGPYTHNGSTTADQVVFEGIAEAPTEGRIRYVLVKNQGSEMDEFKPDGSKAGRSDQIITDINNDDAPHGPEYIRDGVLSVGAAMGTLEFNNTKTYRKVLNDFGEHDSFLFSLRPQGTLDYNNGTVDSGADLMYDGSANKDQILQVKIWKVAKLNQITVNGAINTATGTPYSGIWNDIEDQQNKGINPITIEDATLNSDALCQAKADGMGANETERTRGRFKFRKTTYGFIQPGQTITFKYIVTDYITITEAQYILDKLIMNIKTEVNYAEISSGL